MIRFIDLGNQIYPYDKERDSFMFAWWNTVVDCFETHYDNQTWGTWEEFEFDYKNDSGSDIERYKGLFPNDWPRGVGLAVTREVLNEHAAHLVDRIADECGLTQLQWTGIFHLLTEKGDLEDIYFDVGVKVVG